MSFTGKTALITGACGGLGKAIAQSFLNEGANVVVCDINEQLIADFKEKVGHADKTLVLQVDITSESALDELFAETEKRFGQLDILVNSAGRIDHFEPIGSMPKETWDSVIALNLTAPAFVSKRAISLMLKQPESQSSIVNICSIASFRGFSCGSAYTASKHGLLGLTRNTAAFYGSKGIRCNAIMPGAMATNIGNSLANGMDMEGFQRMRVNFPEESMALCDVNKVAALALYLSSDAAHVINGAAISADSGATAN